MDKEMDLYPWQLEKDHPIYVSFSGGKDSVASWLYLSRDLEFTNVRCVFADTGHESEEVYKYIDTLEGEHGLVCVRKLLLE